MEFYHDLITEKSFKILQDLRKKLDFILIGGWAIFLYTHALKSKDIDMIVDYNELSKIKKDFNLYKNERLKKYEIKIEEVDVDIYLPHFSNLGIAAEEIKKHCQLLEGFTAPIPEMMLILKTYAYNQRRGTTKGRKDLIDIFSLIKGGKIDWLKYKALIKKYGLQEEAQKLKDLIVSLARIPELNLLNHQMAKLKKGVLANL